MNSMLLINLFKLHVCYSVLQKCPSKDLLTLFVLNWLKRMP